MTAINSRSFLTRTNSSIDSQQTVLDWDASTFEELQTPQKASRKRAPSYENLEDVVGSSAKEQCVAARLRNRVVRQGSVLLDLNETVASPHAKPVSITVKKAKTTTKLIAKKVTIKSPAKPDPALLRLQTILTAVAKTNTERAKAFTRCLLTLKKNDQSIRSLLQKVCFNRRICQAVINIIPFINHPTIIKSFRAAIPPEQREEMVEKIIKKYISSSSKRTSSFDSVSRNIEDWLFVLPRGPESRALFSRLCANKTMSELLTKHLLFVKSNGNHSVYAECINRILDTPTGIEFLTSTIATFVENRDESTIFFQGLALALKNHPQKQDILSKLFPPSLILLPSFKEVVEQHSLSVIVDLLVDSQHSKDILLPPAPEQLKVLVRAAKEATSSPSLTRKIAWMTYFYDKTDTLSAPIIHLSNHEFSDLLRGSFKFDPSTSASAIHLLLNMLLNENNYVHGPRLLAPLIDIFLQNGLENFLKKKIVTALELLNVKTSDANPDYNKTFLLYLALIEDKVVQEKMVTLVRKSFNSSQGTALMWFYENHSNVFEGKLPYFFA